MLCRVLLKCSTCLVTLGDGNTLASGQGCFDSIVPGSWRELAMPLFARQRKRRAAPLALQRTEAERGRHRSRPRFAKSAKCPILSSLAEACTTAAASAPIMEFRSRLWERAALQLIKRRALSKHCEVPPTRLPGAVGHGESCLTVFTQLWKEQIVTC